MAEDLPIVSFPSKVQWERWLARHGEQSKGVWLRIGKKGSLETSVSYAEALDAALCFGWIDGQKKALDQLAWLQRFTPRGPRSIWSSRNKQRALELIGDGLMKAPGLAAVNAAKAAGSWKKAYASRGTARVPPDLAAALKANPAAREFFSALDSRNRYAILFRLHNASRPETRRKRLDKFVVMLARHQKIHP
jgi:uncharacterized protein YdeI (YjbR/CyaY-like superfamily)